jgi:predicted  nucleic acid-binding Zn ribbon protein
MILYEVAFGRVDRKNRGEAEDIVESYIAAMLHNGQASGQYYVITRNGILTKNDFKKVTVFFGKAPKWKLLDDGVSRQETTAKNAPFLYLFTHLFDFESPLCRADNGKPIPFYRLPGSTYQDRNDIYGWQCAYRHCDSIWIDSSALEIPAYKQLADPFSALSQEGIKICKKIEKITGVPTYYYLMRYWGRRKDEAKRKCPICGHAWRTKHHENNPIFWQFAFKCKKCRLVSHAAVCYDDPRHAVIGEYKKMK